MVVASVAPCFAALPQGAAEAFTINARPQESQAVPHRVGRDGATRRWACLPYIAGACLGTVACRLRIESPFKAIL
jgi:hypothetical protein